jgi:hypothetical protein
MPVLFGWLSLVISKFLSQKFAIMEPVSGAVSGPPSFAPGIVLSLD